MRIVRRVLPALPVAAGALLIAVGLMAQQPLTTLPYTPSLDPRAMDLSTNPCENFYQYACGTWMKDNPVPPDQARWDVYSKLTYENQLYLWGLLLEAGKTDTVRTPNQQKIGDLFYSCMDESRVAQLGATPIQAELRRIDALKSVKDLPALIASEHLGLYASSTLFDFASAPDYAKAINVIGFADAGGLGLPDRDYYAKDENAEKDDNSDKGDAKAAEIRRMYVAHIARMFRLLGESQSESEAHAAAVMHMETAMARSELTRVERRDPYKLFHKMTRAQLQALTPSFRWDAYFQAIGLTGNPPLNVTQPAFFRELENQLRTEPLDTLKAYLRWHIVHAKARFLSPAFVEENFNFFNKYLRGVPVMQPRWKTCVQLVDHSLGEALGQVFVEKTFTPDTKARAMLMTKQVEDAMQQEIEALPWMSPATKKQALAKLAAIKDKIGYPDKWRDYSAVVIKRDDFLGNIERAATFESHRDLAKIGKPLDRGEWELSPPTVNAYYNPPTNDITFPAGVLQPPLFDPKMDDAPNYGNTAGTIGHELTHGFDDEGRQFDGQGNLHDWWTKADVAEFQKRTDCVVDEYSNFTVIDNVKINGKLTMGEDVADLGGELLAWIAWKAATRGKTLQSIDGLTPDQRFFVGMAQWACGNEREEDKRVDSVTNPHSPDEYRINGVVSNMPEFKSAFACKEGAPMVREKACKVW